MYKLPNINNIIKQKIKQKLNYKLSISTVSNEYLEELGYDDKYKILLSKYNVSQIKEYKFLGLNSLLCKFIKYTKINNLLYNLSKDVFNPFYNVIKIYDLLYYNSDAPVFEIFCDVIDNNLLTLKNNMNFLNCTFSYHSNNKSVKTTITKIYPNINTLNYYDLNISTENLHSKYRTKLYNISEINNTINKLDTKMHLMIMSLISEDLYNKIDRYLYEKYYTQQLFYSIIFVLRLLKKNGTCILLSFSLFTEINIELLFILKKFFKKLILTKYNSAPNMTTTPTKIIASRFNGISKEELDELFKIAEELSTYNNKYDDYNKNYKFINKILDINKYDAEYLSFKAEIVKFNLLNNKYTEDNLNLFNEIVQSHLTNNKIIQDIIIRKQIQILLYCFNRFNLLKIFNN